MWIKFQITIDYEVSWNVQYYYSRIKLLNDSDINKCVNLNSLKYLKRDNTTQKPYYITL